MENGICQNFCPGKLFLEKHLATENKFSLISVQENSFKKNSCPRKFRKITSNRTSILENHSS
jgi:hypothetical protein